MKEIIFIFISLMFYSCSTSQHLNSAYYFSREKNSESEFLNEYLFNYIKKCEPYLDANIYLYDTLYGVTEVTSLDLIKYSVNMKDEKCREAMLDLSNKRDIKVGINFSQLSNLDEMKIIPGTVEKADYKNWKFSFSLPGFSKDSTCICFTRSYYCGPLCACFSYIFMKKNNNTWSFFDEMMIMIS